MIEFDVIIPAGGTIGEAFAKVVNTERKALIGMVSNTLIGNTIECLRNMPGTRRIVVIGNEAVRRGAYNVDMVLPEAESGPKNIFNGLRWLSQEHEPAEKVLIVTCDLPFLTVDALGRFLAQCPTDKDFCVPLVSYEDFADAFPSAEATFVKMKDGKWTTGCAFLATPKAIFAAAPQIEEVFKNRKSKLGMARMLGPKFLMGYMTKSLTVKAVEEKVQQILGCKAVAVPNSPAELAYDIDYVEDYHYALQTLKLKASSSG